MATPIAKKIIKDSPNQSYINDEYLKKASPETKENKKINFMESLKEKKRQLLTVMVLSKKLENEHITK